MFPIIVTFIMNIYLYIYIYSLYVFNYFVLCVHLCVCVYCWFFLKICIIWRYMLYARFYFFLVCVWVCISLCLCYPFIFTIKYSWMYVIFSKFYMLLCMFSCDCIFILMNLYIFWLDSRLYIRVDRIWTLFLDRHGPLTKVAYMSN